MQAQHTAPAGIQNQQLQGTEEPPCPPLSPTTTALRSIAAPLWRLLPPSLACPLPGWEMVGSSQEDASTEPAGICCPGQTACCLGSLPGRHSCSPGWQSQSTLAGQHCPYAEGVPTPARQTPAPPWRHSHKTFFLLFWFWHFPGVKGSFLILFPNQET